MEGNGKNSPRSVKEKMKFPESQPAGKVMELSETIRQFVEAGYGRSDGAEEG
jgi:hypothetical protein